MQGFEAHFFMKICTITYHEVVDHPDDSGIIRASAIPYKHPVKEFTDHVKIFRTNNIQTPRISDLTLGAKSNEFCHIITFDDGGISNIIAADILEEQGFIGHFLITTGFSGKRGFMSNNQIRQLYERGHVIGAHSHSHPDVFYRLPYDKMLEEWKKSKSILENVIGEKVSCASVPGGEMNLNTWQSSAEAGIDYLFCSEPFLTPQKKGNWLLGRVCPKKGSDYKKLTNFINFKGYSSEIGIRNVKNLIKRIYYPLNEILTKRNYE